MKQELLLKDIALTKVTIGIFCTGTGTYCAFPLQPLVGC